MASKKVVIVTCDKCGTESEDVSKFRTVVVSKLEQNKRGGLTMSMISAKDLCIESCLGAPGVNREL
jgi:hypothetical protein